MLDAIRRPFAVYFNVFVNVYDDGYRVDVCITSDWDGRGAPALLTSFRH